MFCHEGSLFFHAFMFLVILYFPNPFLPVARKVISLPFFLMVYFLPLVGFLGSFLYVIFKSLFSCLFSLVLVS